MKIAITADLHLRAKSERPERFSALEDILQQMMGKGINDLIIAGDLFDSSCDNPGEFEKALFEPRYKDIHVYIIPGNHDPKLSQRMFAHEHIHIFSEPAIYQFSHDLRIVFIPYTQDKTYGEILGSLEIHEDNIPWILIGHGDYITNLRVNEYERGSYMPICRKDIDLFRPKQVFLGHIHQSGRFERIGYYPGSPCPIDASESGYHSYIVFDTKDYSISRFNVSNSTIYQNINLLIVPADDEEKYINASLDRIITEWNILDGDIPKVRVRVRMWGYSTNRELLSGFIKSYMKHHRITLEDLPDLTEVLVANDPERWKIAQAVIEKLEVFDLPDSEDEPSKDEIIFTALQHIYGGVK